MMVRVLLWSGGYDSSVLKAYLDNTYGDTLTYHATIYHNYGDNLVEELYVNPDYRGKLYLCRKDFDDDYMPGRNTALVMSCVNALILRGVEKATLYMGFIKNFPRYPDTTIEWVNSMNNLLKQEFGDRFTVEAPFIDFTKDEVYKLGCSLLVKLDDTFSCNFAHEGEPCGKCDNCLWRARHKYPSYGVIK